MPLHVRDRLDAPLVERVIELQRDHVGPIGLACVIGLRLGLVLGYGCGSGFGLRLLG